MALSYPVMLRLQAKPVLVVGAGPVAARKIGDLVAAGARVTVIAPAIVDEIRVMPVTVKERAYEPGDVAGFRFVIVSTNDPAVQQLVFDECEAAGIWCNAADDPERCSVTLPAVARRGPVTVAVATDGASPALAGVLRDRAAAVIPAHIEEVVATISAQRQAMRRRDQSTESIDWKPMVRRLLDGATGDASDA